MRSNLALYATLVTAVGVHACLASDEEDSGISAQAQAADVKPYPLRNVYYGDLHLHTGYSFDAYMFSGVRTGPEEAYRYARGETLTIGGETFQASRPLDFLAVTDHSEWMAAPEKLEAPNAPESVSGLIAAWRRAKGLDSLVKVGWPSHMPSDDYIRAMTKEAWQRQIGAANRFYEPGKFTTFIAYEWSMDNWAPRQDSEPTGVAALTSLHRNVIYRGDTAPQPFTSVDSQRPEDLWRFLEANRKLGYEALAIPHSPTWSNGRMFDWIDSDGRPINQAYAARRAENEPLVEIVQVRGQAETRPESSPNDEFASFEISDRPFDTEGRFDVKRAGGYTRAALGRGLKLQDREGANPYKFGFVGAADLHNGRSDASEAATEYMSSAGLTGVWAESNTRDSIYAALRRKETFATSGTRLKLRFFGGWGLKASLIDHDDWIQEAYKAGVPMGGDLREKPTHEETPSFALWALKDPDGANLDRIQVIKLWVDGDDYREKIFDVILSDGRRADPKTGKAPAVGNTVDLKTATYRNTIGATQLTAVWKDPKFDPETPAVYYIRILEIPTPRWTTIQSVKTGKPLPDDVPATIQERGWSSPIWYTPSGITRPLESANTG